MLVTCYFIPRREQSPQNQNENVFHNINFLTSITISEIWADDVCRWNYVAAEDTFAQNLAGADITLF